MIIFVIELDLWDSNIVFLCKCLRISKWHISGAGGQIWLLEKAKSIRKQKIIISMIMFLIHKYLWGIDAVFLWRYPHISSRTIFELKGWNQVLAEANCSKSSLGWSYFQFTSICEELTLYLSGDIPIFLVGLSSNWEVEINFWQKQTALNHHRVDLISNSQVLVRNWRCISMEICPYFFVFVCKCFCISRWHISGIGGQIWLLKKAKPIRIRCANVMLYFSLDMTIRTMICFCWIGYVWIWCFISIRGS